MTYTVRVFGLGEVCRVPSRYHAQAYQFFNAYAKEAVKYLSEHGRYMEDAIPSCRYFVRYPPTASRAIFASDTHELCEKLQRAATKKEKSSK